MGESILSIYEVVHLKHACVALSVRHKYPRRFIQYSLELKSFPLRARALFEKLASGDRRARSPRQVSPQLSRAPAA